MEFKVGIKKKVLKGLDELPNAIQDKFWVLVKELRLKGPIRRNWPNFSKLGSLTYHCHPSYEWVACWSWEKATILIEVYYAGSREAAPY